MALPGSHGERGARHRIAAIRDQWRIDDEWWRQGVSRCYYLAVLEDGRALTLFLDLLTQTWHCQAY